MRYGNPISQRMQDHTVPEPMSGCWLWTGHSVRAGYGHIKVSGKMLYAHRVSWEMAHGAIPTGMCVCHRCDTPACVNPDHLFLGTHLDNARDKVSKKRQRGGGQRGEENGGAILRESDVLFIRKMCLEGATQASMARKFGVSRRGVCDIVRRKNWSHV